MSDLTILPTVWGFYSTSYLLLFPQPFLPLPPRPLAGLSVGGVFLCLAGVAPSISATSSIFLPDPPLASLDLPGLPGCFFPVINLLNGVAPHLKLAAQPIWDGLKLVICSYKTKYIYATIVLVCSDALWKILLKFGTWHSNVSSLYVLPSSFSSSSTVLIDTCTAGSCTCLIMSKKTDLSLIFFSRTWVLWAKFFCALHSVWTAS